MDQASAEEVLEFFEIEERKTPEFIFASQILEFRLGRRPREKGSVISSPDLRERTQSRATSVSMKGIAITLTPNLP